MIPTEYLDKPFKAPYNDFIVYAFEHKCCRQEVVGKDAATVNSLVDRIRNDDVMWVNSLSPTRITKRS